MSRVAKNVSYEDGNINGSAGINKEMDLLPKFFNRQPDCDNPEGYFNTSTKFYIKFEDKMRFTQNQYNELYVTRYNQLVDIIAAKGTSDSQGKSVPPLRSLSELADNEEAFVIGTVFRRSTKRPSVLDAFDDNREEDQDIQLNVDESPDVLVTADDFLEFEDAQTQTIRLSGVSLDKFATGMVVGFFGTKLNSNDFNISEVILPGPPQDRIPRPIPDKDSFVVFLSDILANTKNCTVWEQRLKLLEERLRGPPFNNRVDRIIICGNLSVDYCDCPKCASVNLGDVKHLGATKDYSKNQAYVQMFDILRKQFPKRVIDVLPGNGDPTCSMWPQDEIGSALVKVFQDDNEDEEQADDLAGENHLGRKRGDVIPVPNPYRFELRGIRFLGTSGDNVNFLRRMTNPDRSPGEVMENMIELCHICPTAPQAPDSYPFDKITPDPLVMDQLPHVFFAGNQETHFFNRKVVAGDKLSKIKDTEVYFLGIPKAKTTFCGHVLNLKSMDMHALDISCVEDNVNEH